MSPVALVTAIAAPLLIGGFVFYIVFGAIKAAIDRAAEALASSEGIVKDSGRVTVVARSRGSYRRNPGRVVLTKQRLHVLLRPQRFGIFERADLARVTVGDTDVLTIASTEPPVTFTIALPDAAAWCDALVAAGARRAS